MSRPWLQELGLITTVLLVSLLLSAIFGSPLLWILLGFIAYLIWIGKNVWRLSRWIEGGLKQQVPESYGIWEHILLQLYRLQKRNRRHQQHLTNLLGRFEQAAQALPDAIVIMDQHWAIEGCNQSAKRLLGIDSKEDIGQRVLNLIRSPALADYLSRGDYSDRVTFPSPINDDIIVSVRIVSYGKTQHLLIARDVTHISRLEKMRQDFVANVSHEMRTPLTVINGYLETLYEGNNLSIEELAPIVSQMHGQSKRMQNLVGDLLLLAKLESSEPRATLSMVNVPQLIQLIKDEAKALSGDKQHDIQVSIDESCWLKGEANELRSAITNLVSNAVRYTSAHGKISVHWYCDNTGAHLEVKDTGIGIPAQHIPRLTERFYRVDIARSRHSGGTGLGLAIVKHVLQRHEAELRIISTPDVGSTFHCHFPLERVVMQSKRQNA